MTMNKLLVGSLLALIVSVGTLLAQINYNGAYNQTWDSGLDGWSYVQANCQSLGNQASTCSAGFDSTGNPAGSLFGAIHRFGGQVGYFEKVLTWEQMGVPAGATVGRVNITMDAKSAGACFYSYTDGTGYHQSTSIRTVALMPAGTNFLQNPDLECTISRPFYATFSGNSGWATFNYNPAVGILSGCGASNTPIAIEIVGGESTSKQASCQINSDNLHIDISYQ